MMLLKEVETCCSDLNALEERISYLLEFLHRLRGGLSFSGYKDRQPNFLKFEQALDNTRKEIGSFKETLSEVHRDLSGHVKKT
ncbi:MAG: hypothetical protein N2654_06960 [Deltaproteobacteria bacterium]|nr:hypothetical protein [Deltaproteobacteria bacterium]